MRNWSCHCQWQRLWASRRRRSAIQTRISQWNSSLIEHQLHVCAFLLCKTIQVFKRKVVWVLNWPNLLCQIVWKWQTPLEELCKKLQIRFRFSDTSAAGYSNQDKWTDEMKTERKIIDLKCISLHLAPKYEYSPCSNWNMKKDLLFLAFELVAPHSH